MRDACWRHYQILSKIGEGGMPVVYRARDEVLHRDVALKVVSREPARKVDLGTDAARSALSFRG